MLIQKRLKTAHLSNTNYNYSHILDKMIDWYGNVTLITIASFI